MSSISFLELSAALPSSEYWEPPFARVLVRRFTFELGTPRMRGAKARTSRRRRLARSGSISLEAAYSEICSQVVGFVAPL